MHDDIVVVCLTVARQGKPFPVSSSQEEHNAVKNMLNEFKDFINKGNLVALAIAFLMALAFAPVVGAFADGVIMNLIAAIFGKPNFDSIVIGVGDADLLVGSVLTALVNFVIVAAVCFLIVKAYDRWQKKDEAAAGPSEVELLTEIRDSLRNR
jgi:large conductance mechanosensitive channel